MDEKEFIFPQLKIKTKNMAVLPVTKFVVAGGRKPEDEWLKKAVDGFAVQCADKGGEYCNIAGIVPQELFGDGDSVTNKLYSQLEHLGTVVHKFNPLKDDTDLQLLLNSVAPANLLVSGIWGGRFDHLYSNIFSLLAYKKQWKGFVAMADEKEIMVLLNAQEQIQVYPDSVENIKSVSLLPLTATVQVSLENVYWELKKTQLTQLRPYAISNVPLGNFKCTCHTGELGLYICLKKDL